MEMKYILCSKTHKTTDAGEAWTFKFKPVTPEYKKHASFEVTTTDPYKIMGQLDLPQEYGDIITLETNKSNVQGTLPKGNKKAVA